MQVMSGHVGDCVELGHHGLNEDARTEEVGSAAAPPASNVSSSRSHRMRLHNKTKSYGGL